MGCACNTQGKGFLVNQVTDPALMSGTFCTSGCRLCQPLTMGFTFDHCPTSIWVWVSVHNKSPKLQMSFTRPQKMLESTTAVKSGATSSRVGSFTHAFNTCGDHTSITCNHHGYANNSSIHCVLFCSTDFAKVNAVYATFFTENPPARACYAVKELPMAARVEIEAIAVL